MKKLPFSTTAVAVALLLLAGCSAGGALNGDKTVIKVGEAVSSPETLKVSDLGSKISYVPFETTDSSLIPESWHFMATQNRLLVINFSPNGWGHQNCLSFDMDGRFLGVIGHTGEDPEAYSTPFPLVSDDGNMLYFKRYGQMMYMQAYGVDGSYKGRVFPQIPPLGATGLSQLMDTIIVSVDSRLHKFDKDMWITIYSGGLNSRGVEGGVDTTVVKAMPEGYDSYLDYGTAYLSHCTGVMPHSVNLFLEVEEQGGERKHTYNAEWMCPRLGKVGGELHFKEPFIDTVYTVTRNSFTPLYTFDCGENRLVASEVNTKGIGKDKLLVSDMCETKDYLVFGASMGWMGDDSHTGYVGYFDKKTGITRATTVDKGFEDDLSGFMPFYPVASDGQGRFFGVITVDDIDKWLEANPGAEVPEPLRNLAPDANPICVMVSK